MERLGLGPEAMLARNPRLVYGRMTGWGQDGPLAARAGHDIDYIALSGVLHAIGRAGEAPVPPLNLVGDFGGGGMLLAFGIACGVIEARQSGRGQVVDAAMIDGAGAAGDDVRRPSRRRANGATTRGANVLDSGAPWYDTYETRDGKHVAIGAIEPKFFAELLARLGLDASLVAQQHDRATWPRLRERFADALQRSERATNGWPPSRAPTPASRPCLSFAESRAPSARRRARGSVSLGGVDQPAPAPRFGRTPGACPQPPPERGQGGADGAGRLGLRPRRRSTRSARSASASCASCAGRRSDQRPLGLARRDARRLQLEQVRRERAHRHRVQLRRNVRVDGGEQLRGGRRAELFERRDDLGLAPQAMRDDRRHRLARPRHQEAVARREPVELEIEQRAQRRDVRRHVAVGRIDDDRRRLHHVVAGEERLLLLEQVAEVVAGVAGRVDRRSDGSTRRARCARRPAASRRRRRSGPAIRDGAAPGRARWRRCAPSARASPANGRCGCG